MARWKSTTVASCWSSRRPPLAAVAAPILDTIEDAETRCFAGLAAPERKELLRLLTKAGESIE